MEQYIVFFESGSPHFLCWAEDDSHAYEQAANAYPDEYVLSVYELVNVWGLIRTPPID